MIAAISRPVIILSLLLVWACSGGLQLVAYGAVGTQPTFESEQNQDLEQQAIEELAHSQKQDTVRRAHTVPMSLRIYNPHVSFREIYTSITPDGQTANRASSRPLHQKISYYLI
jgi:hypothetical protein